MSSREQASCCCQGCSTACRACSVLTATAFASRRRSSERSGRPSLAHAPAGQWRRRRERGGGDPQCQHQGRQGGWERCKGPYRRRAGAGAGVHSPPTTDFLSPPAGPTGVLHQRHQGKRGGGSVALRCQPTSRRASLLQRSRVPGALDPRSSTRPPRPCSRLWRGCMAPAGARPPPAPMSTHWPPASAPTPRPLAGRSSPRSKPVGAGGGGRQLAHSMHDDGASASTDMK